MLAALQRCVFNVQIIRFFPLTEALVWTSVLHTFNYVLMYTFARNGRQSLYSSRPNAPFWTALVWTMNHWQFIVPFISLRWEKTSVLGPWISCVHNRPVVISLSVIRLCATKVNGYGQASRLKLGLPYSVISDWWFSIWMNGTFSRLSLLSINCLQQ